MVRQMEKANASHCTNLIHLFSISLFICDMIGNLMNRVTFGFSKITLLVFIYVFLSLKVNTVTVKMKIPGIT